MKDTSSTDGLLTREQLRDLLDVRAQLGVAEDALAIARAHLRRAQRGGLVVDLTLADVNASIETIDALRASIARRIADHV